MTKPWKCNNCSNHVATRYNICPTCQRGMRDLKAWIEKIVKCEVCGKEKQIAQTATWEMQHLHFADKEIEMLTCEECKLKSPTEFLQYIKLTDEEK